MRISPETTERIKQAADIVEVVGDFVSLKKRGVNYTACCPFHNEKSPSFNVNPVRQIFKCFGCGAGGDSIKFVMDIEGIGYGEALRFLAQKYSIEIEEEQATPEEFLRQNERESLYIVLNFAQQYFQKILLESTEGQTIGLSYFRGRSLTDQTIKSFGLGYSLNEWDGLLKEATKRGYNADILEKAGLVMRKEGEKARTYDRFRSRVMFPVHNVSGKVIAFGARILIKDPNQPKYLNSPETDVYHKSKVLYGIYQAKNAIRAADICYLVEGYTDVISLHQAGIQNVVASSGTSLTEDQIKLIARFTPNVTILYDGDAAGIKAAIRGLDMVLEEGLNVSLVLFPDGEDPDSFVYKVGAEAFKKYINDNTKDFITFKTEYLLKEAGDNPFKRAEAIGDIVSSISKIPDPIKRQIFTSRTADLMRVDEQTLISEGNRILRKKTEEKPRQRQPEKPVTESVVNQEFDDMFLTVEEGEPMMDYSFEPVILKPKTTPASPSTTANVQSKRFMHEQECVRLLICHATQELEPDVSLCHYVLSELGTIEFETPVFQHLMDSFRTAFARGEVLNTNYFVGHQDTEIQQIAITLVSEKYELSENWERHEIFVPTEIDKLAEAAYSNILRIKKSVAEQRMAQLQGELKAMNDIETENELLRQFMYFKDVDKQISGLLGVIVSR
jgi:DNA primase